MGQIRRPGLTSEQKTELWDRWQRGESLTAIGRAFGKPSSSIYCLVSPHGGIRPLERRRSKLALTLSEREEISRGLVARYSIRSIARMLGRAPSTVSREVSRNGGYRRYRAARADAQAWARARRPKQCKLATHAWLRQVVARQLRFNWSPEQIAGWLKRAHPRDEAYQVSHETIYRSLFVQTRGVLKKELMAEVEDRAVPGHWEGDLLSGPKDSYIVTLVERHTRYVMLAKVADKSTQTVDLGSRQRTDRSSEVQPGDRYRCLLLRSAKSVAAGFQREYQPPAATVLPQGYRFVGAQPSASQ
jgi:IS30 family transposase